MSLWLNKANLVEKVSSRAHVDEMIGNSVEFPRAVKKQKKSCWGWVKGLFNQIQFDPFLPNIATSKKSAFNICPVTFYYLFT